MKTIFDFHQIYTNLQIGKYAIMIDTPYFKFQEWNNTWQVYII